MLFRLRSGHNSLKSFKGRWKQDEEGELDTFCDHEDCLQEQETTEHVLTRCPAYNTCRTKLKNELAKLDVELTTANVLGLNDHIPKHTQLEIRDLLIEYLNTSKLADRI